MAGQHGVGAAKQKSQTLTKRDPTAMKAPNTLQHTIPSERVFTLTYALIRKAYLQAQGTSEVSSEARVWETVAVLLQREWLDFHPNFRAQALRLASGSQKLLILAEEGLLPRRWGRWLHEHTMPQTPFVAHSSQTFDFYRVDRLLRAEDWDNAVALERTLSQKWMQAQGGTLFIEEGMGLTPYWRNRLIEWLDSGKWLSLDGTRYTLQARLMVSTTLSPQVCARCAPCLYYRLLSGALHVPPLRKDPRWIPRLLHRAVQLTAQIQGIAIPSISTQVMEIAQNYPWPGNLVELAQVAQHMVSHSQEALIRWIHLPRSLRLSRLKKAAPIRKRPSAFVQYLHP